MAPQIGLGSLFNGTANIPGITSGALSGNAQTISGSLLGGGFGNSAGISANAGSDPTIGSVPLVSGNPTVQPQSAPATDRFNNPYWNSLISMLMQRLGMNIGGGGQLSSGGQDGGFLPTLGVSGMYGR